MAVAIVLVAAACGSSDGAAAADAPGDEETATHPGVTDDTINIGFVYVTGAEEFAQALGTDGTSGSTLGQIEAVVDAVNEAGGIAGRQVNLVGAPYVAGEPTDTQLQAACATFTQDNKVFAVGSQFSGVTSGTGAVLYDCLAENDVALIEVGGAGDTAEYERHPAIAYAPTSLNLDRSAEVMIDALEEADWFGDGAVVGIHSLESPVMQRVIDDVVKPKLEEIGYPVEDEFHLRLGSAGPENIGDYGAATLRFKTSGVTHVLNIGNHPLFFAGAAAPQDYFPKYSFDSEVSPANWSPAMPPGSLEGALGIGWAPSRDVAAAERGEPVNSAETRCADIMSAAGEDSTAPVAWSFQLTACTSIFFLEASLDGATGVDTSVLAERVASMEDSYLSPVTWETRFEPDRRDALGAYRMLGFVPECSCLRYVSDLIPTP